MANFETAHEGEVGKDFAVVVDEVRKLAVSSAEQSKTTTNMLKKIKSSIDNINRSIKNVIEWFEHIDEEVRMVAE